MEYEGLNPLRERNLSLFRFHLNSKEREGHKLSNVESKKYIVERGVPCCVGHTVLKTLLSYFITYTSELVTGHASTTSLRRTMKERSMVSQAQVCHIYGRHP